MGDLSTEEYRDYYNLEKGLREQIENTYRQMVVQHNSLVAKYNLLLEEYKKLKMQTISRKVSRANIGR
ncbi:MAG: hypothetical protein ABH879_01725 [archaeon]